MEKWEEVKKDLIRLYKAGRVSRGFTSAMNTAELSRVGAKPYRVKGSEEVTRLPPEQPGGPRKPKVSTWWRRRILGVKQWLVNWLLAGVHIQGATFGASSITLSPAGSGDVARWSGTQTSTQSGDMGMDVGTGRPSIFVRGVTQPVSHLLDITNYGPNYATPDFTQAADVIRQNVNLTITAASNTNPIILTLLSTGTVANGDVVFISGVTGNTGANGLWQVGSVDATHMTLLTAVGNGAYGGGGVANSGMQDVSQSYVRIFANTQPGIDSSYFSIIGGNVSLPDVAHTTQRLRDLKVIAANVFVTGFIWQSTSVSWVWPSTVGQNATHVRLQGPGTGGVIQLRDPATTHLQKWLIASFHGAIEFRGFTFMGDPNLATTSADTDSLLTISGFWTATVEHNQFYGVEGTNNVLNTAGVTGGAEYKEMHFSSCGLNNPGGDQTKGIWQHSGSEGGTIFARNVFGGGQLPGFQPANKAQSTNPAFAIAEEETAGTPTGTGYIFEENFFFDGSSAAIAMQPIAANSHIGHVSIRHCYFFQNCVNAIGNGCVNTAGTNQVLSVTVEHCFFNLNNGTGNPAINVPSASGAVLVKVVDCEIDGNFHVTVAASQYVGIIGNLGGVYVITGPSNACNLVEIIGTNPGADTISGIANVGIRLVGTPTVNLRGVNLGATALLSFGANVGRVDVYEAVPNGGNFGLAASLDVSVNKPAILTETFKGIRARYMTDSGAGFAVNLLIKVAGNGPTVAITNAATPDLAQDVIGVAQQTTGAGGYGPVAFPAQDGITFVNDGVGALASGSRLAPSSTTSGRVKAGSATNCCGNVETDIAAAAGSTGTGFLRAA